MHETVFLNMMSEFLSTSTNSIKLTYPNHSHHIIENGRQNDRLNDKPSAKEVTIQQKCPYLSEWRYWQDTCRLTKLRDCLSTRRWRRRLPDIFSHGKRRNSRSNTPELVGTKDVPRDLAAQWRLVRDLRVRQAGATRYVRICHELNYGSTYSSIGSSSRFTLGGH